MGGVIDDAIDTHLPRAVGTAVDVPMFALDTMSDDAASTMTAGGSEDLDGALKGVEVVGLAVVGDLKRPPVGVAAAVTGIHGWLGEFWVVRAMRPPLLSCRVRASWPVARPEEWPRGFRSSSPILQ